MCKCVLYKVLNFHLEINYVILKCRIRRFPTTTLSKPGTALLCFGLVRQVDREPALRLRHRLPSSLGVVHHLQHPRQLRVCGGALVTVLNLVGQLGNILRFYKHQT